MLFIFRDCWSLCVHHVCLDLCAAQVIKSLRLTVPNQVEISQGSLLVRLKVILGSTWVSVLVTGTSAWGLNFGQIAGLLGVYMLFSFGICQVFLCWYNYDSARVSVMVMLCFCLGSQSWSHWGSARSMCAGQDLYQPGSLCLLNFQVCLEFLCSSVWGLLRVFETNPVWDLCEFLFW